MIIKYLIYFALGYLIYKFVRSMVFPKASPVRKVRQRSIGQIDDIMIKDPFCETYFPKRDGIHLKFEDKDLYFCSTDCRDRFIERNSNAKQHND
jgi:hypothetical protein